MTLKKLYEDRAKVANVIEHGVEQKRAMHLPFWEVIQTTICQAEASYREHYSKGQQPLTPVAQDAPPIVTIEEALVITQHLLQDEMRRSHADSTPLSPEPQRCVTCGRTGVEFAHGRPMCFDCTADRNREAAYHASLAAPLPDQAEKKQSFSLGLFADQIGIAALQYTPPQWCRMCGRSGIDLVPGDTWPRMCVECSRAQEPGVAHGNE